MAIMADTLVIVCCHSIFHGTDPNDESHWALQPFQRSTISKPGEHTTFLKHIRMALNFQGTSDKTVVFSGGHTNPDYPDLSEAQSYLNAAVAADGSESVNSVILEDQATDTYQNILFSILKYHAVKGCYPGSIVVVTHDFKSQRVHLHQQAIRWSKSFRVYALNPPFSPSELSQVQQLEHSNAYAPFLRDPYGIRPPLSSKRLARGWDEARLKDVADEESVVGRLLRWKGGVSGEETFGEVLPWE